MSVEYLRRLRDNAEARRAMYPPIGGVETMQLIIARQVQICHSAILSDEKDEPCGIYDAIDNMSHIAQQIVELSQQIKNAQTSNVDQNGALIIEKLYTLANFISEVQNMPQLRRIYNSGEIIYRLNYISRSAAPIDKIQIVVQYMSWITTALTQNKSIIKTGFAAQNKYYERAICAMCPTADPTDGKAPGLATRQMLSIKYMFKQLYGEA